MGNGQFANANPRLRSVSVQPFDSAQGHVDNQVHNRCKTCTPAIWNCNYL